MRDLAYSEIVNEEPEEDEVSRNVTNAFSEEGVDD